MTDVRATLRLARIRLHFLVAFALAAVSPLALPHLSAAAEPAAAPKSITADQARQHVGQLVIVTFKVQHAKSATKPDRVYLDSEKDYRDPKNLGVLIEADALPAFTKAGIDKPATHYDAKTIRITGKPFLRDDTVFIKADRPDQIQLIDPKTNDPI